MTSKQRAVLLGLAALTVVVAAIIASSGGGGDEPEVIDTRTDSTAAASTTNDEPATTTAAPKPKPKPDTTVVVRDGESVEGIERFRYRKGSTITFTVKSDVADEIHMHGYDVSKEIAAGGSVRFAVPATVEGRFEVELEQSAIQVARVEVLP